MPPPLRPRRRSTAAADGSRPSVGPAVPAARDQLAVVMLLADEVRRTLAARTVAVAVLAGEDRDRLRVTVATGAGAEQLVGGEHRSVDSLAEQLAVPAAGGLPGAPAAGLPEPDGGDRLLEQVLALPVRLPSGADGVLLASAGTGGRRWGQDDLAQAVALAERAVTGAGRSPGTAGGRGAGLGTLTAEGSLHDRLGTAAAQLEDALLHLLATAHLLDRWESAAARPPAAAAGPEVRGARGARPGPAGSSGGAG